jgi:hypothetical protein
MNRKTDKKQPDFRPEAVILTCIAVFTIYLLLGPRRCNPPPDFFLDEEKILARAEQLMQECARIYKDVKALPGDIPDYIEKRKKLFSKSYNKAVEARDVLAGILAYYERYDLCPEGKEWYKRFKGIDGMVSQRPKPTLYWVH